MKALTVVGGGFAGLVAAISCAESGTRVRLLEAHRELGGRARATTGPYIAHDGPHVLYADGPWWRWLKKRRLVGRYRGVVPGGLAGFRFRWEGSLRRTPPAVLLPVLTRPRLRAPAGVAFRTWAEERFGSGTADAASNLMGVATFDADPGRLSADFVLSRLRRVFAVPPPARYVLGGWNGLLRRLCAHARGLGVEIETGTRVTTLPEPPVIVATSLDAARQLLHIAETTPESGRAVLLDLATEQRRGDLFVVSDLDEAGWLERYSLPDPSVAPQGESLVQAQMPMRPGESRAAALARLEALVDAALAGWRERVTWRRDAVAAGRSGALDLPGQTWRDRPAVNRGGGVFLAGDMVAAPGLLSEVSFHSAIEAARAAGAWR
jgi:phytoene dehydrogenase-like protein